MDEQKLVKTYMELTGTTESAARNVLILLGSQRSDGSNQDSLNALSNGKPLSVNGRLTTAESEPNA